MLAALGHVCAQPAPVPSSWGLAEPPCPTLPVSCMGCFLTWHSLQWETTLWTLATSSPPSQPGPRSSHLTRYHLAQPGTSRLS